MTLAAMLLNMLEDMEEGIADLNAACAEALKRINELEKELEKERTNHRQTIHTADAFRKALERTEADVESLTIKASRSAEHAGLVVVEREQLREDLRAVAEPAVHLLPYLPDLGGEVDVYYADELRKALDRHGVRAVLAP